MPPNRCTSSVCSCDHGVDDVVDRDDADDVAACVDHRHGEQVVFGDQPRDLLAAGQRARP